jgi:hypothetical protein
MSFWTAIVVIVAIISITELIKSKHRAQRRFEQRQDGGDALPVRDDPEARREIEDLRERIKVLERIATDGNSVDARETQRISREIEALRDRQDG